MEIYNKEILDNLYNKNIYEKNKNKLLLGGIADKFLLKAKEDNRMSLDILIRISPEISDKIEKCILDLKNIESDLYFYPRSDFHITVLDILKAEENRIIPENISEYIDLIKKCLKSIKPFKIELNGLTASDNAIMIKGYYEYELQKFRDLLRKALKGSGLKFEERYETISSHITIARFPNKIKQIQDFIDFIEKERNFGILEVNNFELSFHNWYDTQKQKILILKF